MIYYKQRVSSRDVYTHGRDLVVSVVNSLWIDCCDYGKIKLSSKGMLIIDINQDKKLDAKAPATT